MINSSKSIQLIVAIVLKAYKIVNLKCGHKYFYGIDTKNFLSIVEIFFFKQVHLQFKWNHVDK